MTQIKKSDHRHYFARIRTQLANERTLMSYYRASLALVGLSAFVFKFYEEKVFYVVSALFLALGITLGIYGILRYYRFKQKLLRK
jgi:uncharacterized membrane protein YidH (DUF202 family)